MYSRTHPYFSTIKERKALTSPLSSKQTYHVVLDRTQEGLDFKVGDSVAVLPTNDVDVVEQILQRLHCSGDEEVEDFRSNTSCSFREYLLTKANISKVSFHKIFPVEKTASPLIELVQHHRPTPRELCKVLLPLLPRFYSIASSPKVYPDEIHLTVAMTTYEHGGQTYFGVGSHFLCKQAVVGSTLIPIYVQPSNHFTLPEDPNASMILIGPGTGIAPFRAFLQERIALQAPGRNWIFFGERNRASDFYYSEYWEELEKQGRIRLDTAFSRDQKEKIYVQHKMLENRRSLWEWIQEGSFIYVCGDAEKMAKDVDATLQHIIQTEGSMNEEKARHFLKNLKTERRYLLDVY